MSIQPAWRSSFTVAILCAQQVEYNAVRLLANQIWDQDRSYYDKWEGDFNQYITCRFGEHNVVLVLLSRPGKASWATAAARLKVSFTGIQTICQVGVCGGAPKGPQGNIFLGNVIIGDDVVWSSLGRTRTVHPGVGGFHERNRLLLALMSTSQKQKELEAQISSHLLSLYKASGKEGHEFAWTYHTAPKDQLFEVDYQHKHHWIKGYICIICDPGSSEVCADAAKASCQSLRCDIQRSKLRDKKVFPKTKVHFGVFASANTILKSATHRNDLNERHNAIGFDTDAAGIMDELQPILIKGVSNYADGHNDERWLSHAAAAAASTCKAILEHLPPHRPPPPSIHDYFAPLYQSSEPIHFLPFARNENLQGRQRVLLELQELLFHQHCFTCVTLYGLGGIGKSQVALEIGHQAKNAYWYSESRGCSVLWIPVFSTSSFNEACAKIIANIPQFKDSRKDTRLILKEHFSSRSAGSWLIILDSADDQELMFGNEHSSSSSSPSSYQGLMSFMPESDLGSILITSRNREIGLRIDRNHMIRLAEMSTEEASQLFMALLKINPGLTDISSLQVYTLAKILEGIPLAITQAAAYINRTHTSVHDYLTLWQTTSDEERLNLFHIKQQGARYSNLQDSIASIWLLSFKEITEADPIGGDLLVSIACIEPKAIRPSMLLVGHPEEVQRHAIKLLLNYAFLTEREEEEEVYDMHTLVHAVLRQWIGRARLKEAEESVQKHLEDMSTSDDDESVRSLPELLSVRPRSDRW